MYEQRSLAIPRLNEVDELGYMLFGGRKCSGAGLDDVVHIELQVPVRRKRTRGFRSEVRVDGTDEVTCTGPSQDIRNVAQGADMDGGGRFGLHDSQLPA